MKKVFTTLFAAVLLASSFTCMAAETPQQASDATATLAEAEMYAYLDLDSASPAMKEKILASRNTIIYSKDWVADGHTGYVTDVVTGEIIETLPSFSSLFPDWDLPVNTAASPTLSLEPPFESASRVIEQEIAKANASDWLRVITKSHYLPAASNSHNAAPFATFIVNPFNVGDSIRSNATALSSSQTCNIGFQNVATGVSLGYRNNLARNQAVVVNNVGGMNLAIRASTHSIPGYATMAVDGANRYVNVK